MKSFIDSDKKTIGKEVEDQFTQLISAINHSNAEAWQKYYSKEHFLSAIVNTDQYATRSAWGGYHNTIFLDEGWSAGGTIRRARYGADSRLGSPDESREV